MDFILPTDDSCLCDSRKYRIPYRGVHGVYCWPGPCIFGLFYRPPPAPIPQRSPPDFFFVRVWLSVVSNALALVLPNDQVASVPLQRPKLKVVRIHVGSRKRAMATPSQQPPPLVPHPRTAIRWNSRSLVRPGDGEHSYVTASSPRVPTSMTPPSAPRYASFCRCVRTRVSSGNGLHADLPHRSTFV